ncbi:MAG: hypothetical protein ABEH90_05240 [Halolamina sp.]
MNVKYLAIAAVALLVVIGGVVGAFALGFGPAPGEPSDSGGDGGLGGGGGEDGGDTATATFSDTVIVEATGTEGASGTDTQDPFSFVIDSIEECGDTCREVTATITNNQNETATGVKVRSEIYTGDNYDNKVWEGTSDVGELPAGESFTDTKTVELGYAEAYSVRQNDGKILIKTYVITDGGTYVFKDERDVA